MNLERGTSADAHVRTPFPYLGNSWMAYAEIWYVVGDQLVQLHISLCISIHLRSFIAQKASYWYIIDGIDKTMVTVIW